MTAVFVTEAIPDAEDHISGQCNAKTASSGKNAALPVSVWDLLLPVIFCSCGEPARLCLRRVKVRLL